MPPANKKNILIACLCLLVLAQGIWILRLNADRAPDGAPDQERVADFSAGEDGSRPAVARVEITADRKELNVFLTAPIAADAPGAEGAATIEPQLEGRWTWASPTQLQFTAAGRFRANARHTVAFAPALGLRGEARATVRTGSFVVTGIDLDQRPGDAPGTVVITARLAFNQEVAPEDALANVTLTDLDSGTTVPLRAEQAYSSQDMDLASAPVAKTPAGRTYRLDVGRGLTMSGSDLALDQAATARIAVRLNPELTLEQAQADSARSGGSVRLKFSTPVAPEAAQAITVAPRVEFAASAEGTTLVLDGPFRPGATYALTLPEGFAAADGARLPEAQTRELAFPDLPPSVEFVGNGMFLPRGSLAGLALDVVNTDTVRLRLERVYPNNVYELLRDYDHIVYNKWYSPDAPGALGGPIRRWELATGGEPNAVGRHPLRMKDALPDGERGMFLLTARGPGDESDFRWIVLTDIGLVAKREADRFLVWAISNTTLEPLPGVALTLVSTRNQPLATATTGPQGTASLAAPRGGEAGAPFLILAQGRGGDFTFLHPARLRIGTTGLDVAGVQAPPDGLRAYLYGERDLYRPGETIKGMAVVRGEDLSAPPAMPLVLVQKDPRGRTVRRLALTTGAQGQAAFEIALPEYAPTGAHSLELLAGDTPVGGATVKVEEFIPDRIKVEVRSGQDSFAPGQTVLADMRAAYLFGPPAAGLPVTARAVLRAAPFTPPGFEDYIFGDPQAEFQPQEFFTAEGTLDTDGAAVFEIALPGGLRPPAALEATILGRVSEAGGRGVTARKAVAVHAYPYYLGVRNLEKRGVDPGKPVEVEFVAVDPAGRPCDHGALAARLYRDRWRSVLRRSPSGDYRYESVNNPELLRETIIPAGTGASTVRFTPETHGSYRVVVAAPDTGAAAGVAFYAGGWGFSPWAMENPARVELVPDKEQYQLGDTAVIQVRAPFAGRLLVAVEGQNVNDTRVVELRGNTGEVRFPVKAAYAPNVHVTAILVRKVADLGEGSVARAFGAVPLLVDNLANRMRVAVSAPAEVRPESGLDVEVDAEPGAVVTIAAVDEGIMQLSGAGDPDPFGFFYARRALGVQSFDTFAMLFPDLARVMGAARAGGGAALAAESRFMSTQGILRVKPVALWSGPLVADARGRVRHSMALPDFQGALRIVAVGLDGRRFGTGRATTRVRAPLAVTPTLPRFLAAGDTVQMPVTVRNDLGRAAEVTVLVEATGAVHSPARPTTLRLDDAAEATIYMPLAAREGGPGAARVAVTASGGGETRRVAVDLPVRPALPLRRTRASGTLPPQGGALAPAPAGYVPGTVSRSVVVSHAPMTAFTGRLEFLLRYPYGCAEQVVSQAFPLLRFGALARELAPELTARKAPAAYVQGAIARLGTMQTDSGGFALWPGGDEPEPWVSAYATHFLLEAAQAGYGAPILLGGALEHMNNLVRERRQDWDTVAYALFVLAKADRPDRGTMDELRDNRLDGLGALARTLLACAYAQSGDLESFGALLRGLPEARDRREDGGGMASPLRDAALTLLALADAAPDSAPIPGLTETVSRLMTADGWGTTQENALGFAALGKILAAHEPVPMRGRLLAGDTRFPVDGLPTLALTDIPDPGPLALELDADQGPVFWSVTTQGVPEAAESLSRGLEVRRAFLDRSGRPLDAARLTQGDLVLMRTEVRSTGGEVRNVVVQALLPAGLEVENQRLATTEAAALAQPAQRAIDGHQDLRDDRVLFFADAVDDRWSVGYTQLRAVSPGSFALPPVQAEAMYDPDIVAADAPGRLDVVRRE
ncbi:alpha-2-macroglobulin [Desulfocurvus sp.]|uniref:alpha-2-macroglobulin family protein n=1 Tax=Desulfocurvus sp. TaxID=2871698 RepID=UPI0025B7FFF4|nr:alpha-2-macroglobulin [Desulfocurvus sp.]MCK9240316.1 alpha-2-macroglobulin family protein [Desulfocurvus sp.]